MLVCAKIYVSTFFIFSTTFICHCMKYENCSFDLINNVDKGFHREISVPFNLSSAFFNENFSIVVEFDINRHIYVDIFELQNLSTDKIQFWSLDKIDVEQPEYQSKSVKLFVSLLLSVKPGVNIFNLSLPIHLRYHLPSYTERYVTFNLSPPNFYLISDQGEENCLIATKHNCTWKKLNCQKDTDELFFSMPVGNMNDFYQVVILTTVTTIACVFSIIYTIVKPNIK